MFFVHSFLSEAQSFLWMSLKINNTPSAKRMKKQLKLVNQVVHTCTGTSCTSNTLSGIVLKYITYCQVLCDNNVTFCSR